jgi:hypothetical protein
MNVHLSGDNLTVRVDMMDRTTRGTDSVSHRKAVNTAHLSANIKTADIAD